MILTDFGCNLNYTTVPSSLFNHIISGSFRVFHAFVVGCLDFKGHTCRFQRNPLNVFFSLSWSSTLFAKSQRTQAIGKSYLESYILEFLHLQAARLSIDLAAISQRSKYLKVHRKVKFLSGDFESQSDAAGG
jgi:hypothetical protein